MKNTNSNKTLNKYKFENATAVTCQTLVGVMSRDFPLQYGNCFSVSSDSTVRYKIVNFILENLQELLKQNVISWPVKILPISNRAAVIVDERIPEEWYSKEYCEICCPFDLLPHNQQMTYVRKLLRGDIEEIECSNGIMVKQNFKQRDDNVVYSNYLSVVKQ